jgi:hypothetical protein
MAKTILIPIDFTVESLNTLKLALDKHRHEQIEVLLMYAQHLSDAMTDLYFFSSRKSIQALITPVFDDALTILKNSFESTTLFLRIEFFHGINVNSFIQFAEANSVQTCYIPANYRLKLKGNAFNPLPFITRSGVPYEEIPWTPTDHLSDEDQLQQLFI